MNENTKRKIMGKRFYVIYRRVRFIRYKKKLSKQRQFIEAIPQKEIKDSTPKPKKKKSTGRKIYTIYRKIRFLNRRRISQKKQKRILIKEQITHAKQEQLEIKNRLIEKKVQDKFHKQEQKKLQKLSKAEIKKRRRRLLRYFLKRQFMNFIVFLKTFDKRLSSGLYNAASSFVRNKEKRNNYIKITLNSFSLFLLSYFVFYVISMLVIVWVARSFDYRTIMFYYKIYYNIDTGDWTADSVKILYSIAPLTGLFFGTVFLIIFSTFRNERGILKLFFLWGFIHGMIMFFGSLLMGTLLNKDFGWVISYLYFRDTGKMVFSIFSIFALVALGGFTAKSFLISGNTYLNYVDKSNKRFLLWSQVILPVILGTIVLVLIKIPNNFYFGSEDEAYFDVFKHTTIILFLIPLIIAFGSFNETYFDEDPRKIRYYWKSFLLAIIIWGSFRIGLSTGVHFG
jgi:hypothetical protein